MHVVDRELLVPACRQASSSARLRLNLLASPLQGGVALCAGYMPSICSWLGCDDQGQTPLLLNEEALLGELFKAPTEQQKKTGCAVVECIIMLAAEARSGDLCP